ncbi:MAG: hypothetical protein Q8P41_06330 [Pseudomonadota bacterium]|nr:hypothetical protein [Pseudomonadota bacterium]
MPLLLALSVGCAVGPYGAPSGAEVSYPGDAQGLIFDITYNDPDDGIGLLIKEFVTVTMDDASQDRVVPLNNIQVEITSGWPAAYVIPSTAVQLVDEYEAACEGDGSAECDAWFDIGEEHYYEFAGEYQDLGGLRPTYMSGGTDNRGTLEFYVFVDSIPYDDDGEVIPIPMYASIVVDTVSWSYDFE